MDKHLIIFIKFYIFGWILCYNIIYMVYGYITSRTIHVEFHALLTPIYFSFQILSDNFYYAVLI